MDKKTETKLKKLFKEWSKSEPKKIEALPAHGSARQYYRLSGSGKTGIGAYNLDKSENIAFLSFSRHFLQKGLPVPEIYAQNLDEGVYLEQDLGDTTLFSYLDSTRQKDGFSKNVEKAYEKVILLLPQFQITAAKDLNYKVCYPRHSFDNQSMMWDLNYFKYYFLKLAQIPFDEQKLEDDFQIFTKYLLAADREYFLYRDFQSRNIMLMNDAPFFIDYQGGRKGALQYDVASLLYDAKADIPEVNREYLLHKYIDAVCNLISIDKEQFLSHYIGYVFIRIMQALGAYGFRGFYERKKHFLRSVPYAIQNLENLLRKEKLPIKIPELYSALSRLVQSADLRQLGDVDLDLTVRIQSFSYRRGIPWDERGHGGGFVLDCRSLPNPGREQKFANKTGQDQSVINYLKNKNEVEVFLNNVFQIIDQSVINYQKRNFTDLMIAFGCTGGQHRSVYCANLLHDYLKKKYAVNVQVRHRELEMK